MFDNLLSNARPEGQEESTENGKVMMKTKTITKNYGTRLGKPTTRVSISFYSIGVVDICDRKKRTKAPCCAACECFFLSKNREEGNRKSIEVRGDSE